MLNTVTINTALDRLLFIDAFNKNCTNRISKSVEVMGGKGTHVSVNLSLLGVHNRSFGVVRGETGRRIMDMLDGMGHIDVSMLHGQDGNSRTNYAIIERDGACTLITEGGQMISKAECEALMEMMEQKLQPGDYLLLSGDASNTEIPFIYNVLMERLKPLGLRVFLDTSSKNLAEALKASPFLVKPNLDELIEVMGEDIRTAHDIVRAMEKIHRMGVQVVAVSCGADGSYLSAFGEVFHIPPLPVEVQNTIGCGDAYFTGLAYGFYKQLPIRDTLRMATAIAAATAESELTVGFDVQRAEELANQVRIERLEVPADANRFQTGQPALL